MAFLKKKVQTPEVLRSSSHKEGEILLEKIIGKSKQPRIQGNRDKIRKKKATNISKDGIKRTEHITRNYKEHWRAQ